MKESLEPKKLALIRILQLLKNYSDDNHVITHDQLIALLESEYGINIERKAIGRNISLLKEAGYKIETVKKGSYLTERMFEDSELRLLIDGVLASYYITSQQSKELIDKLCGLSNKYFKKHVKNIYSIRDWNKTENFEVFRNIEIVDEAIESGYQIRFNYNKYGADKALHKTAIHCVSPYQMILNNQRYYLMGYNEKWKHIQFYRLDRITDIVLLEVKQTPLRSIEGFANGINYKEISCSLPYMFSDKPQRVEFLAEDWVLDQVVDWFGKDIRIVKKDNQYLVSLNVSINAMEYWAMQYLNAVEVVYPSELRQRIAKNLQSAIKKYS